MPNQSRYLLVVVWLICAAFLAACSDSAPTLTVRAYTGLVAGPEFRFVETTVLDNADGTWSHAIDSAESLASFGNDFARGRDVATYSLPSGAYRVRVRLLRPNGVLLVERVVALTLADDTVLPVHLTRDCVGVVCPSPGGSAEFSTCLAGRCVDPRCAADAREFCPSISFCNDASECDTPSACAESVCEEGVCAEASIPGACEGSEWCNPDVGAGCQPFMMTSSESGVACGTICTMPTEPCRFGYWACVDDSVATCTPLQTRPVDSECGVDRVCDVLGDCVMREPIMPEPASITVVPTVGLRTTEAGGSASFTVRLGSMPDADVVINFSSSNITEGVVTPSSVTFSTADWSLPQTITVTGVDDPDTDGDVEYTVMTAPATSTDARYNGFDAADVTATNEDDDVPAIVLSRTSGLVTSESGTSDSFTVALATPPTADVTIPVAVESALESYTATSALTFNALNFSTPQTVVVVGVDDLASDGNALVHVVLSPSTSADPNYDGLDADDVSVTNIDDDTPGVTISRPNDLLTTENGDVDGFDIQLNTPPTADVTIDLASGDETEVLLGVPPTVTFTPDYWGPFTIYIQGVDDPIDDGDKTFAIVTSPAVSADPSYDGLNGPDVGGINTDNDVGGVVITSISAGATNENLAEVQIGFRLLTEPEADVTVPVTSLDTSEGTVTTAPLTFTAADWSVDQIAVVVGVDDAVADGDVAYDVRIGPATGADPAYTSFDPHVITLTNYDNDIPSAIVTPTTGLTTTEMGGSATFSIVLGTAPDVDVTIGLSSSDATEGSVSPSSVTFTPSDWDTPQTITITGVDDALVDGNIAYTIITSTTMSATAAYNGYPVADVSVTNIDAPARMTITPTSGLVTSEFGATATFTAVLDRQPTADVTVGLTSSNLDEGTVAPASVTFNSSNWNTPQVVTVSGVNDMVLDGDIAYSIVTSAAASSDPLYAGVAVSDVGVVNRTALVQQAYAKASNPDAGDNFGQSVAVSSDGNTVAIGAFNEDSNAIGVGGDESNNGATDSGAVYVFTRTGSVWSQQAYLKASNTEASDRFGWTVALSDDGNTLAVGAPGESSGSPGINGVQNDNSTTFSGAVYVFTRAGATWSQEAYIKASDPVAVDAFGSGLLALSSDGNTLAVASEQEDSAGVGVGASQAGTGSPASGAVYVFTRAASVWTQQVYIKSSNSNAGDVFGYAGALSGDGNTLVVGALFEASNALGINGNQADNSASNSGAAYVFVRSGMVWTQQAYIKASNARSGSFFGSSAALSHDGNTLVVGAHGETSCSTGINGDQANTACMAIGAAYAFTRAGVTWTQEAYIKPAYAAPNEQFGQSVSISSDGNRIGVGAWYHRSGATGVNGSESDTSRFESGAVTVFGRIGAVWSQEAFLKASTPGAGDHFGFVHALSADAHTLVVGALDEDSAVAGVNGDESSNGAGESGAVYMFSLY